MNVNEIYNLIKNAVCLQCRKSIGHDRKSIGHDRKSIGHDRKDKGILDVMKQPAIVTV